MLGAKGSCSTRRQLVAVFHGTVIVVCIVKNKHGVVPAETLLNLQPVRLRCLLPTETHSERLTCFSFKGARC